MNIKKLLKYIKNKVLYGRRYDSESYVAYLRSLGMKIGERTQIFNPPRTTIDETRPWMIEIGSDVQITEGVTILTHGYDWSVLKGLYGEVLGSAGGVFIGNNVFLGMHSTILKGVHIGNNVIIGANSLVNDDIPDNCVAAGNPCKVIMNIDEYYKKRKDAQLIEATELVRNYRERYGKEPDKYALREFFWLFSNRPDELPEEWKCLNRVGGNEIFTNEIMRKHKIQFENFAEFLKSVSEK